MKYSLLMPLLVFVWFSACHKAMETVTSESSIEDERVHYFELDTAVSVMTWIYEENKVKYNGTFSIDSGGFHALDSLTISGAFRVNTSSFSSHFPLNTTREPVKKNIDSLLKNADYLLISLDSPFEINPNNDSTTTLLNNPSHFISCKIPFEETSTTFVIPIKVTQKEKYTFIESLFPYPADSSAQGASSLKLGYYLKVKTE